MGRQQVGLSEERKERERKQGRKLSGLGGGGEVRREKIWKGEEEEVWK